MLMSVKRASVLLLSIFFFIDKMKRKLLYYLTYNLLHKYQNVTLDKYCLLFEMLNINTFNFNYQFSIKCNKRIPIYVFILNISLIQTKFTEPYDNINYVVSLLIYDSCLLLFRVRSVCSRSINVISMERYVQFQIRLFVSKETQWRISLLENVTVICGNVAVRFLYTLKYRKSVVYNLKNLKRKSSVGLLLFT